MDPISLGLTAVSIGMQFFGGKKADKAARARAAEMAVLEKEKGALRMEAINMDALTSTRDAIRQSQLSASLAANRGANSGAGMGSSGILASIDQAESAGDLKIGSIDQSLKAALKMNDVNTRIGMAGGGTSNGSMIAGIGSTIGSNARTIGKMFGEDGQAQAIGSWTTTTTRG